MKVLREKWDESYRKGENFILYPKEEAVKFLNRFVRKKSGINSFTDIINFSKAVRALDFGCGIGRLTILMREFGIDAYGVDISSEALRVARQLSAQYGYKDMTSRFVKINGLKTPFKENYFDITMSEGVLDSMRFDLAIKCVKEIYRVTNRLLFVSLIACDGKHGKGFSGENTIADGHEKGTIQSYFNMRKIKDLFSGARFKIEWCHLITDESVISEYISSRYYIVLSKDHRTKQRKERARP